MDKSTKQILKEFEEERIKRKKDYECCKKDLETFFTKCKKYDVTISSKNFHSCIDDEVARYLLDKNHSDWLCEDVTFGPMVGGISERVLIEFARKGWIFKNVALGFFRIEEHYAVHSARYFEAWPYK
jgi:hypothetical protein